MANAYRLNGDSAIAITTVDQAIVVATPAFLFGQTYCCGPLRSSSGNRQAEGNQELERATALSGDAKFKRNIAFSYRHFLHLRTAIANRI